MEILHVTYSLINNEPLHNRSSQIYLSSGQSATYLTMEIDLYPTVFFCCGKYTTIQVLLHVSLSLSNWDLLQLVSRGLKNMLRQQRNGIEMMHEKYIRSWIEYICEGNKL